MTHRETRLAGERSDFSREQDYEYRVASIFFIAGFPAGLLSSTGVSWNK